MKNLFAFLICLPFITNGQDLHELTLSTKGNLEKILFLQKDEPFPRTVYVLDSTKSWNPNRFTLTAFAKKLDSTDEHHPYRHSFLFRDSTLAEAIPAKERERLSQRSLALQPGKRNYRSGLAKSLSSFYAVKEGYMIQLSEPVTTTDETVAFVDFLGLLKSKEDTDYEYEYNNSMISMGCIIFKKENGKWKQWKLVSFPIF